MTYKESQLDLDNRKWFHQDTGKNTLLSLSISGGNIRGVYNSELTFTYPITALVGENGSGKTTFLSLAACAFHNDTSFCPFNRISYTQKKARVYYTYGDFFTFAPGEAGIQGIQIKAKYLSSTGEEKIDIRKKKPSGKWNDFANRPKRVVSYLGINRILPPAESSPHKHYYKLFSSDSLLSVAQLKDIQKYMSRIFGRNYSNVKILSHNTYRLFSATWQSTNYSGFNMGAGENAVLQLLVEIMSAEKGALLVIDEIELGLHAKAQKELIQALKEICLENHSQIICSTHSKIILESLPRDARYYIRRVNDSTEIIPEISADFAFGQLAEQCSEELAVFVEDEVGASFLGALLPKSIKERISIHPIGSADAILHQMAAYYRVNKHNFIAFQDGDQRSCQKSSLKNIKKYLETNHGQTEEELDAFFSARLSFLPGEKWPEKVLVEYATNKNDLTCFETLWHMPANEIKSIFEKALSAEKHSEFYEISKSVYMPESSVRTDLMRQYRIENEEQERQIVEQINKLLG